MGETVAPLRALLAVPTRGYIWHETASQIARYEPIFYREKLSVANVRNKIAADFLDNKWGEKDLLYMVDDDVIPPHKQFAERMASAPFDIVGAPTPMAKMPHMPVVLNIFNKNDDGNWVTCQNFLPDDGNMPVDAVGTGLIMVRRHVLEHPEMAMPFNQVLTDEGVIQTGQDINFCIRAKQLGFSIGVCADLICDHFTNVHLNTIPFVYGSPVNSPSEVKPEAARS